MTAMTLPATQNDVEEVLRKLVAVWADFETRLNTVPIIQKLNRERLRVDDYLTLLANLRQQVKEGARWIARAASNVTESFFDIRSAMLKHAVTEHKDFRLLDRDYVACGGDPKIIEGTEKNIGSEALSAWMFHRASQENPFDLLGAMFIIEGLGNRKAREWGMAIKRQLNLGDDQVSFLLYHGENDADHMAEFETLVGRVAGDPAVRAAIVKTAKVTGRLYQLQLEELDRV
jgi:3-oxoacyl-[acyl-carrier-protein] synthase-3